MPDRLSLMLDSMVFAVDNGLSFDGVVSIPAIGLEDFGHRPGIVGWIDGGAEWVHQTTLAIFGFFRGAPVVPVEALDIGDKRRARDSGIDTGENEEGEIDPGSGVRLPRKRYPQIFPRKERFPRKKYGQTPALRSEGSAQGSGDAASPNVGQGSSTGTEHAEDSNRPFYTGPERHPRLRNTEKTRDR